MIVEKLNRSLSTKRSLRKMKKLERSNMMLVTKQKIKTIVTKA